MNDMERRSEGTACVLGAMRPESHFKQHKNS